jgi:hypothetical protein
MNFVAYFSPDRNFTRGKTKETTITKIRQEVEVTVTQANHAVMSENAGTKFLL